MASALVCVEAPAGKSGLFSTPVVSELLGEGLPQFAQPPFGVRMAGEEQVDGMPQQAHQAVAATAGVGAFADQFPGQGLSQLSVVRAEQAVVGDAQRLRVVREPGFLKHGKDFRVAGRPVVDLAREPYPQP
ncbi:hypothetical protein DMH01_32355 [Amycolatopsis sp. WAC 04182]|nr:hypothetical protein DMH01_32355 [Amycolatopsis sp. WAC 04182]